MSDALIFKQIPKVMEDIAAISKDRDNKAQGFKFRGIDDVYNELHPKLAKHGVFTVPEVLEERREDRPTKSGGISTHVILKIKYTVYASDGSHVFITVIGEGADTGDKATNKAMSIAHKYAFLQIFAIPTKDNDDGDGEKHEFKREDPNDPKTWVYPFDYPEGFKGTTLGELGTDGIMEAGKSLASWKDRAATGKTKTAFPAQAQKFMDTMREMLKQPSQANGGPR